MFSQQPSEPPRGDARRPLEPSKIPKPPSEPSRSRRASQEEAPQLTASGSSSKLPGPHGTEKAQSQQVQSAQGLARCAGPSPRCKNRAELMFCCDARATGTSGPTADKARDTEVTGKCFGAAACLGPTGRAPHADQWLLVACSGRATRRELSKQPLS